jgi:hypothetical protein
VQNDLEGQDYFLCAVSVRIRPHRGILDSATGPAQTARARDGLQKSLRSCIFDTRQLKREPSLACGFGKIGRNYRGNSGGF